MARILMTGANRGIGLELTKQYLQRGDDVLATCRCPDLANNLSQLKDAFPERLTVLRLDVTAEESTEILAKSLSETSIDLLISNAGIMIGYSTFEDTPISEFRETFETNVFGMIQVIQKLAPYLKDSTTGKLVQVSSSMASISCNTKSEGVAYRM